MKIFCLVFVCLFACCTAQLSRLTFCMFLAQDESLSRFHVKNDAEIEKAIDRFKMKGKIPETINQYAVEQIQNPYYSFELEQGGTTQLHVLMTL